MPIFTTPISTQNTAGSAGVVCYPDFPLQSQYSVFADYYKRTSLTPAGAWTLYSTGGVGTPTFAIQTGIQLLQSTTNGVNDDASCWTSGFTIARNRNPFVITSTAEIKIVFNLNSITSVQNFFGVSNNFALLTALPTTTSHMGVYLDTSAQNTLMLSSADGTTQTTVAASEAVSLSYFYLLDILWTGTNSATINLSRSTTLTGTYTNIATKTVSSIVIDGFPIHYYMRNLTAVARSFAVQGCQISVVQ